MVKEPIALACSHQERYTFQSWMTGKHSVMTRAVSDAKRRSGQHTIGSRSAPPSANRHVFANRPIGGSANRRVLRKPIVGNTLTSANRRAHGSQPTGSNNRARAGRRTRNNRTHVGRRTRNNQSAPAKQHARPSVGRPTRGSALQHASHRMLSLDPVRR